MNRERTVIIRRKNDVVWLYLNRPDKMNAMNPQMHRELSQALDSIEDDDSSKVLVITGKGNSFCSGLDVVESFVDRFDEPIKLYEGLRDVSSLRGWNLKLRYFPKPTIACVNGYCFAGGFNILSACDLALASDKAKFGISEINFGHIPAGGTTWSASEFLLPKHALELILTGKVIDAKEAERVGLINRSVSHDNLIDETNKLVELLKSKNPIALRTAKWNYLLSRRLGPDLMAAISSELAMLHENTYFSEAEWVKKALQKFKEKKFKPGFETFNRNADSGTSSMKQKKTKVAATN